MSDKRVSAYIDTSALAKWYFEEAGSQVFTDFLLGLDQAFISSLTITELRSLLARRQRMGELDSQDEMVVFSAFADDVTLGHVSMIPIQHEHFTESANLISQYPECSLKTLDALHLAVARRHQLSVFATSDKVQADVAKKMGFDVRGF